MRDLEDTLARARRSSEALAAEAAEAAVGKEAGEEAGAAALVRVEQLKPDLVEAEAEVAAAEAAHANALAAVTRLRVELDERRAAAARAEETRRRALERATAARARLEDARAAPRRAAGGAGDCAALAERLGALRARAAGLVARLEEEGEEEGSRQRGELQALAAKEAALASRARRHRRAAHGVAGGDRPPRGPARRARRPSSTPCRRRSSRRRSRRPEGEDEARALAAQLERLERRRDRIGPVNPLAEAECAELGERAAFLREQRRDLERSLEELEALIAELNTQIDAEFAETFAAVQEQFAHMVEVLFPGGRGRLLLEEPVSEDEPGGVTVEVKPARKLGKKLALLSGGERALVAIAFLMALVLARPCPFYILDEIEAALDDVNIGRLVQLLRDYRQRTQFIIITHQKRTMEAADVLYGVTMGPDGGSAVVSARMAEEEIEREERAKAKD